MTLFTERNACEKTILLFGVIVLLTFLVVYFPLTRERREITEMLEANRSLLERHGYGMEEELIMANLRTVESELRLLRNENGAEGWTLETDPFLRDRIDEPFQYFEFDRERNAVVSQLRVLASENGVVLNPGVTETLPEYVGQEREYRLWAQLALANQVLRGAVRNGLGSIESLQLPRVRVVTSDDRELYEELTLTIRVIGPMDALQSFLLYLAMDADQVEAAGLPAAYSGKRPLFVDQFVLRKKDLREPEEVIADLSIKSFIKIH